MNAGKYYDSTVYFLDQKYPDYKDLKTKSQNLNSLVEHHSTSYRLKTACRKWHAMSENERDALIAGIIDEDHQEMKVKEKHPNMPTGPILASTMKIREDSRIILPRKGNGIFIIRLPCHSDGLNFEGDGERGGLKITGEDRTKQV